MKLPGAVRKFVPSETWMVGLNCSRSARLWAAVRANLLFKNAADVFRCPVPTPATRSLSAKASPANYWPKASVCARLR